MTIFLDAISKVKPISYVQHLALESCVSALKI